MLTKVKFALLGCSHPHSRMHLRTLLLLEEVEAVCLWDPEEEALAARQAEGGERIAAASTDLEAILSQKDVDFVLVARRNDETPDTIIRAAQAGKHVLTEKPLATSVAEAERALAAVREAGVTLGVYYCVRFNPVVQDLRRWVAEGMFGRPLAVEVRLITSQVKFRNPQHWLFDREKAGGGILSWLACHYIDLVHYILQDEFEAVTALVDTLSGEDISVEDVAAVAFRLRRGTLGTLQAGYMLPRSRAGYEGATYDTYFALKGTDGGFKWEPFERVQPQVHLESVASAWVGAPERIVTYHFEPSPAYGGRAGLEFVRAFLQAAQRGEPPPVTGEDALRVLRFVEAAYESSRTGQRVQV